jgi:hypothetical protein
MAPRQFSAAVAEIPNKGFDKLMGKGFERGCIVSAREMYDQERYMGQSYGRSSRGVGE